MSDVNDARERDDLALGRIRAICLGFGGGAEESELQNRPLFHVRRRRFAPSPHHGGRGWLALRLDRGDLDWDEIAELLESAYRQVAPRHDG